MFKLTWMMPKVDWKQYWDTKFVWGQTISPRKFIYLVLWLTHLWELFWSKQSFIADTSVVFDATHRIAENQGKVATSGPKNKKIITMDSCHRKHLQSTRLTVSLWIICRLCLGIMKLLTGTWRRGESSRKMSIGCTRLSVIDYRLASM